MPLPDDTIVHRVGGAAVENLRLGRLDAAAVPPGLSVLTGGTPGQAAAQMRAAYQSRKWQAAEVVASASAAAVRAAGFDVVAMSTNKLPNHARLTHPAGLAGFTDDNLRLLAQAFQTTPGTDQ